MTRRGLLGLALSGALLAFAVYGLGSQLSGIEGVLVRLAASGWWLAAAATTLQALRFAAYGELSHSVLAAGGEHVSRGLVMRSTIAGAALGKTLPGSTTAALAVMVRVLKANGCDAARVTAGLAASGALSSVTLAALLPVGALLTLLAGDGGRSLASGAGVAAGVVLGTVVATAFAIGRPESVCLVVERVTTPFERGPLRRWVHPKRASAVVRRGLVCVLSLLRTPRVLVRSAGWAVLSWLLDLAVFLLFAATMGRGASLATLLLVYVAGQLVAAVPITPGGVGVVETAMIAAMVATGSPADAAAATVLGWRLFSHLLPIAAGFAVLPSLRAPRSEPVPR